MGIFHDGWRDKMTVRTNPAGEGKAGKEAAMESPLITDGSELVMESPLTGEGEAGGAAMVSPRTGQGGTGQGQPAAGVGESSLLKAATEQRARAQRDIYDIDSRFMGSPEEIDNLHPYRETDEGQKRMAEATARKQEAEAVINELTNPAPVDNHKYLADWSSDSFYNIVKGNAGKHIPLHQAISDYNYWAQKHDGEQLDMYQLYPMLLNKDISKSFEQNEEDEQTRKRKERWQQIGNVLSHMANLYGTIHYAPSQDIEDGRQLTERQQRIWDAERRERNNNVNAWLNLWYKGQQEKARERRDAAYIQLLNTRNDYTLGKKENEAAESGKKQSKMDSDIKKNDAQTAKYKAEEEQIKKLTPEKVKEVLSRIQKNLNGNKGGGRKGGGGKGAKEDEVQIFENMLAGLYGPEYQQIAEDFKIRNNYDQGNKGSNVQKNKAVVGLKHTRAQMRARQQGRNTSNNNTPPSRRNNNNNTPPSRRK